MLFWLFFTCSEEAYAKVHQKKMKVPKKVDFNTLCCCAQCMLSRSSCKGESPPKSWEQSVVNSWQQIRIFLVFADASSVRSGEKEEEEGGTTIIWWLQCNVQCHKWGVCCWLPAPVTLSWWHRQRTTAVGSRHLPRQSLELELED